jgi:hypothetical protein
MDETKRDLYMRQLVGLYTTDQLNTAQVLYLVGLMYSCAQPEAAKIWADFAISEGLRAVLEKQLSELKQLPDMIKRMSAADRDWIVDKINKAHPKE